MQNEHQYGVKTGTLKPPVKPGIRLDFKYYDEIRLGGNVDHRICRPAWTSESSTGMFNSSDNRHGRRMEMGFFQRTKGLYKMPDSKRKKRNVAHTGNKRGGSK